MTNGLWLVENMDPGLSLAKNRVKQLLKERGHSNPDEGILQLAMPLRKVCGRCTHFTPRFQQEGHICAVYSWPVYSEDRAPCKTRAEMRFEPISMVAMIMEKTYTHEEMKDMVVEWYHRKSKIVTQDMFNSIQIQRVYRAGFTYELAGDVMMLDFEDFEDRSKWTKGLGF